MSPVGKVLYVVSRFPQISATFTAHEMAALTEAGVQVAVASVWRPAQGTIPHPVEQSFLPGLIHLRLSDPGLWFRVGRAILRRPLVLWLCLRLFVAHLNSIYAVAKALTTIPKGLALGEIAHQQRFDQIHAHFLTAPAAAAMLASAVSGIPYSVTIHAFDIFATEPRLRNSAVRLKCERATLNVVISDFNRRFMQERWKGIRGRFEVLYNGIDLNLFRNPTPARYSPGMPLRILSNGRLVFKKGFEYLIRAVAQLIAEGASVELRIIGEGPLMEPLRGLCAELGITQHVHLLGKLSQTQVVAEYQQTHLFVLACAVAPDGDMDGMPTVLLESLAMCIPSISTKVSGVPEIIRDGETGLCIPPHDVEALVRAIQNLRDEPEKAHRMAQAGRALIEQSFDRTRSAQRLLNLWQEMHP
ncbi:MAG: glycosyltransferase family 4 protein [Anaerolinea sp.]|nr:glycosyltransferase family 4 protein [Anaerolinea sp.]CAG1010635.1 colanic acid/amylovoran biosynthesis glycosyltransferase [Anaerolineae bacterium]